MEKNIANVAICSLIAIIPGFRAEAGPTTPTRVTSAQLTQLPYYASGSFSTLPGGAAAPSRSTRSGGLLRPCVLQQWAVVARQPVEPGLEFFGEPSSSSSTQDLRGNWHWTTYTGGTSNAAFKADFVAHFAYVNLANGNCSGATWNDKVNQNALGGPGNKMIIGYPGSDPFT